MGRYVRKCKKSGEVAVMEKAAETAAAEARKRKIVLGGSELSTSSIPLKAPRSAVVRPENSASPPSSGNSTCGSVSSGHALASCCSSTRSSELAKEGTEFADLEENEATVEFLATSAGHSVDIRHWGEKTPSSEVEAELGELESTVESRIKSNSGLCSTAEKMPTEAELEEFFAAAETNLQKQFIDKYNYDIVTDKPLEGRYEWVQIQLKP